MQNPFTRTSKSTKRVPIKIASQILGVSIDTVRRWDKKGVLHSTRRSGKDRLFDENELMKLKEQLPLTATEAALSLKVSLSTLSRLEKSGLLVPVRNKAGRREYPRSVILAYKSKKSAPQKESQLKKSRWTGLQFLLTGMAFGVLILGICATIWKEVPKTPMQTREQEVLSVSASHSVLPAHTFETFNTDHGLFVSTDK